MHMAKRLISLSELDEIEGLIEHHRKLQERIEALETQSAQFDTPAQGTRELAQKANGIKRQLTASLERILDRIRD